ncbi:U2 snRNP complex subunit HSH49 TDEL_0B01010 [Torulaspora delbrueckii]|uniref:RRM domain-containing protein n=1 Tax=Torulaspora delbrueckii TaxID=4950 RepID=G8ZNN6_TORDE|nr:hypothetical protein TDEL_0B01010 [Torulaspora delbrueckii]CCE90230.1 hypothetical protein TDEL_0B01010 [Torulaspora delbrueckii]
MNASLNNPETTVYVGNIDPKVTKENLYELFVQVSPIANIRYPKDKVLQLHQGFAFVEFYTPEDCQYVVQLLNNTVQLYDRFLKVRKANVQSSGSDTIDVTIQPIAKVFVKNLDPSIDEPHLSRLFGKFGPLAKGPEIFYLSDGQLRCAYIYFKNYDHSDLALATLNGQLVVNKKVTVDYAFKENGKGNAKYGEDVDRLLNREARKHGLLK